jgi:DNA-binding transcriptional LysR family regulator
MELRHLRYFLAVAEARHMTRAAERLGIQQPPLSQQIKALEAELGCELFQRHPKGVELTAGGKAFLPEARAILARLEVAVAKAALAAQGLEGSIAVGVTSSAATHPLIPRIINTYRETYPNVKLILSDGSAADLSEAMAEGRLHAAFLRAPVTRSPQLTFHHLLDEEMLLILPAGHRLLDRETGAAMPRIPLRSIAGEPLILVRRPGAPGMYSNLLEACQHAGFTPKIAAEVERMLPAISFVAAGVGVSAVPASMLGVLKDQVVYCHVTDSARALVAPLTLMCRADEESPTAGNLVRMATSLELFPQWAGALVE